MAQEALDHGVHLVGDLELVDVSNDHCPNVSNVTGNVLNDLRKTKLWQREHHE